MNSSAPDVVTRLCPSGRRYMFDIYIQMYSLSLTLARPLALPSAHLLLPKAHPWTISASLALTHSHPAARSATHVPGRHPPQCTPDPPHPPPLMTPTCNDHGCHNLR